MKLSIKEKKVLYAFGCTSWQGTVTRLKWLTSLAADPGAKRRLLALARKVERGALICGRQCVSLERCSGVKHSGRLRSRLWIVAAGRRSSTGRLRTEMDEYFRRRKMFRLLKGGGGDSGRPEGC